MFLGIAVDRLCMTMHTLAMLGKFPDLNLVMKSEDHLLWKGLIVSLYFYLLSEPSSDCILGTCETSNC